MKTLENKQTYITRTITISVVSVNGYNRAEKKEEVRTEKFIGKLDAFEDEMAILDAFDSKQFRSLEIVSVNTTTKRRKETLEDFIKNSVPMNDDEEVNEE